MVWFTGNYARKNSRLPGFAALKPRRIVRDLQGLGPSLGWSGNLEVRLATTSREIRKAQRLRYKVFYEEGGARPDRTAALIRRDICAFDRVCDHLIVIDHAARTNRLGRIKPKVVGSYRLLRQEVAQANRGFYSAGEFELAPLLARHADKNFLELGRSCVAQAYRGKRTLELLWRGLWAYVQHHRIDVMIGCASLPGTNMLALAGPLAFLHDHARAQDDWQIEGLAGRGLPTGNLGSSALGTRKVLAGLPPLIKAYLRAGARFGTTAVIDHQFGTTDLFVMMLIADISPRYIAHFSGECAIEKVAA